MKNPKVEDMKENIGDLGNLQNYARIAVVGNLHGDVCRPAHGRVGGVLKHVQPLGFPQPGPSAGLAVKPYGPLQTFKTAVARQFASNHSYWK